MDINVKSFQQFEKPIDPHFLKLRDAVEFMVGKKVVFITTSTRWSESKQKPNNFLLDKINENTV